MTFDIVIDNLKLGHVESDRLLLEVADAAMVMLLALKDGNHGSGVDRQQLQGLFQDAAREKAKFIRNISNVSGEPAVSLFNYEFNYYLTFYFYNIICLLESQLGYAEYLEHAVFCPNTIKRLTAKVELFLDINFSMKKAQDISRTRTAAAAPARTEMMFWKYSWMYEIYNHGEVPDESRFCTGDEKPLTDGA